MEAVELVEVWKRRQQEILSTLPQDLQREYSDLSEWIRAVEVALGDKRHLSDRRPNVPRSVRKKELVRFLRENGPCYRAEIMARTGIPNGSLALLLKDPAFVRDQRHMWTLSAEEEKTDCDGGADGEE